MFKYQAPPDLLKGRTIVITGAGSGIGKTAALTFAHYGASTILVGRIAAKLEAVYDEIKKSGCPQSSIYLIDLASANESDYQIMAKKIGEEFQHLDGLLHNAGQLGDLKPLSQYNYDTWQQVLQVNVTAPFLMTRELLPLLKESNDASIVLTSSSVGHKGRANWGAYSVSKFASEGLMQILASEEGINNIRCNSLNPGGTRTSMRAQAFPAENPDTLPTPKDIMPLYLYLFGADSQHISGHAFHAQ